MEYLNGVFYYLPHPNSIESDLAKIRSWGFNSINIPLFSETFCPSWELVDESYFNDVVDIALNSAERHGLYVILDLHQYRLSSFFNKVDIWASGLPHWLFDGYENSLNGYDQAWYDIIWNRKLKKGYDSWDFLGYVWEYIAKRYNGRNVVLWTKPLERTTYTAGRRWNRLQ